MKNKDYSVADLSQEDLKKVQKAEQEINQGTDSSKILIAYDKKSTSI
ncbi:MULTISPECIES: hypothetical protein [Desulfosporosinus]|uniref:Uncharacterized protein n=1 Tax=Desulfosporosinus acididurans TaxID=476652 RepID=A0A0J1FL90_9FIRM|nr:MULTISPECIES: hypothetical protein [Desulfosporosinus]KLU64250.1 hypothetical protein DEAC_c38830 [Desulfosporosinus acididurans]